MSLLSKEELIKLYETTSEETLKKLGVYEEAKRAYDEKQKEERLREQRFEQARELVIEAQELLDEYGFELRVTARGIRFVNEDGRTVRSHRQRGGDTGDRAPRGAKTPQAQYRIPILQALVELGGEGQTSTVLELVYEQMKDDFVPVDLEKTSSGALRWNNTAKWERSKMVQEGLLRDDSPHGIWEISEKGRQYLQEHI